MKAATLLGFVLAAATLALPAVVNAQGQNEATNAATVMVSADGRVPFTWTTNADNAITITSYKGTNRQVTVVTIPDSINGLPVTSIGARTFLYCNNLVCGSLTSVTIPEGVTNIGTMAFGYCYRLTDFTIPANVISIGCGAFKSCTSLTNVTIGSSVVNIGDCAFLACIRLTSVTIPSSVTNTEKLVFGQCRNLTRVYFEGNAPTLGENAFDGATNATIYYIERTKGWGPTFGGRPTAVWKPEGGTAANGVAFSGVQR